MKWDSYLSGLKLAVDLTTRTQNGEHGPCAAFSSSRTSQNHHGQSATLCTKHRDTQPRDWPPDMAVINLNIEDDELAETITAAVNTAVEKVTEKVLAVKASGAPRCCRVYLRHSRADPG